MAACYISNEVVLKFTSLKSKDLKDGVKHDKSSR